MQDFADFARHARTRVDAALVKALTGLPPGRLTEAMSYSLTGGGKRIRPLLVYAAYLAVRGDIQHPALDASACAVEAVHAYSLIHDDLPAMDDDDLRRGRATCHIAFGEAMAILAGDALQTLAFELLADAPGVTAEIRLGQIIHLTRGAGARGMVLGQAIDLEAVATLPELADLEHMHRCKTGALIDASVTLGALLAGADASQLTALQQYSRALGLAFQVQDDILDITSDTATLGKQQGADMARGKPTYVSLMGLEPARQHAARLVQQACNALGEFSDTAEPLRQLARYIVDRQH